MTAKKNGDDSYTYKTSKVEHSHMLDARDKAVKDRMQTARGMATTTAKSTRELYANALAGASEEVAGRMPKQNAFGKAVRLVRKGDHPKAPQNLSELVIPEILTTTGKQKTIYISSFTSNNVEKKIII